VSRWALLIFGIHW